MVALSVAVFVAGCGKEPIDPVDRAERSLRDLQSGVLHLELTATTEGAEPVGFSVDGPFSVKGDQGDHVVAQLRYRQLLGGEVVESTLISTGSDAWLRTPDTLVALDESEMESLRLDDQGGDKPAGLGKLDLSGWVVDSTTDDGPTVDGEQTRRIRGELDAGRFIADLATLAADTAGRPSGASPSTERSEDDLEGLVERSGIEILLAKADDAVRRIDARVRFSGDVPDQVRAALGRYAAVELRLVVEIDRPNKPVTVRAPRG